MAKQYDVIVIGAGNGGLISAAVCAQKGLKTLLLEKHNIPGGCATSFKRGRFEFETSLHELCDYGPSENPGDIRKLFEKLGIQVDWHVVKDAFRAIVTASPEDPGYDVTMPTGRTAFIEAMEAAAPGCRPSVKKFFDLCDDTEKATNYMSSCAGSPDPAVLIRQHGNFLKIAPCSVLQVLDALQMPAKAQNILLTYWSYLGASADILSFTHYARMVTMYVDRCAYIPDKRSHEISCAIAKRIEDFGGEIWYNTEATKILAKDHQVYGLIAGDEEIHCKHIISNLMPHVVYGKMLDNTQVPVLEIKKANARKFGSRGYVLYLGLNKSPQALGIKDYTVFLSDTADSVKAFRDMGSIETNRLLAANCLNIAYPTCSPAGTSIVYFTTLYTEDAWFQVKPENYAKVKNAVAEKLLDYYETATGIRLRDAIEEIEIATPITFARYLGTPEGVIYGYLSQPWDGLMPRIMTMNSENTTKGLRFCGGHGVRLSGYSSSYISGELAAMLTLRDVKEGI